MLPRFSASAAISQPCMASSALVRSDDVLARAQRGLHETTGHAARAADQLDHDVDVGAAASDNGSFSQRTPARSMSRFLALRRALTATSLQWPAAAQREEPAVLGQKLDDA